MREKIRDIDHLRNILNFTDELLEVRSRHTLESLQTDKVFFYGVVKEVEMIGEAAFLFFIKVISSIENLFSWT